MRKIAIFSTLAMTSLCFTFHNEANAEYDIRNELGNIYVSGAVGYDHPGDVKLDDLSSSLSSTIDVDPGIAVLGSAGYNFSDHNIRTELELGYRNNDVGGISGASNVSGDINVYSVFANALYDFKNNSKFTPYAGAGFGFLWFDADKVANVFATSDSPGRLDGTKLEPAIQGILGGSYPLNENLDLFAEYHYVKALGSFDKYNVRFDDNSTTKAELEDYDTHSVFAGIRYRFGRDEAIPMQIPEYIPPVDISRSYLVFFDFDKYYLTGEAQQVLEKVAEDAARGIYSRVIVTGHTDKAGSENYNEGLSEQRAKSVKSGLVTLGLPADKIDMQAKGETQPMLPTADGVKEAQNRRVEIVYTVRE